MSRILVPVEKHWYDHLKVVSYYGESDFERSIRQHLDSVFADHYVFPFKKDVTSKAEAVTKKPDMAMIRHDFKAWGIIEVELGEHNLSHVLDQTAVFLDGNYNAPDVAAYIRTQLRRYCSKRASLQRLTNLLCSELPSVLVIADEELADWREPLKRAGVGLCVFEVYRSTSGKYIYRTCGNYPVAIAQEAQCRRDKWMPNTIEVVGNFMFGGQRRPNNEIDILFDDMVTSWSVLIDNGKTYLRFLGTMNPLSSNDSYTLLADKRSRYFFKRI
jgi:hypothetical protein